MEADRCLVVDANILVRAVLGPRARNIILESADRTAFFAPEVAYEDARKYLPALIAKRGVVPGAATPTLEVLDAFEGAGLPDLDRGPGLLRDRRSHLDHRSSRVVSEQH